MTERDTNDYDKPVHSSDTLLPLVYNELRKLARSKLKDDRAGQSIGATGLVHEAFVRLSKNPDSKWSNRGHFFTAAGEAMRRILIERARRRQSIKNGGNHTKVELEVSCAAIVRDQRLIKLDEALSALECVDARKANLVKLRFFVGLTNDEIADAMQVHLSTVSRDWAYARAWLRREMNE